MKKTTEYTEAGIRFGDFNISGTILNAVTAMGYKYPTKVQEQTIPLALEMQDLIVLSKTGSGKTTAFGIPVVQLITQKKIKKALILAPTRELAIQVEAEVKKIARGSKLRTTIVYGRHNINVEIQQIEKGVDILVGTPGRVLDHIQQGNFEPHDFDMLVLDEADRMLDMGFIKQVDKILKNLNKKRINMLFSATIPDEIVSLSQKYLTDPHTIMLESESKTVEQVDQFYYKVSRREKRSRLLEIIASENPSSCLVFCNTRNEVDRLTSFLNDRGIKSKSIHGANSQTMRIKFLNQFKKGSFDILVATDVAARGLHIDDLELVINYDLPIELDSYVHRIGRTGRAGKKGKALSLVSSNDMYQLYMIEEHIGVMIPEKPLPKACEFKEGMNRYKKEQELFGIRYIELDENIPTETKKTDYRRKYKDRKDSKGRKDFARKDKEQGRSQKPRRSSKTRSPEKSRHNPKKATRPVNENANHTRIPEFKTNTCPKPTQSNRKPTQSNRKKRGVLRKIIGIIKGEGGRNE